MSTLAPDERATVIATITVRLPPMDALRVLTALAGLPEEIAALSTGLRKRAREAIWTAFPNGINVVVLSTLGLAAVEPGGDWDQEARDELERLPSWDAALAKIRADLRDGDSQGQRQER